MKIIHILCSGILLLTVQGCNNFKSKHPQAEMTAETNTTGATDKSILIFTTAIDRQLSSFKKEFSLIYTAGDLSLYAEKYSEHNNGMLYRMSAANGDVNNSLKRYYFKNDSLILVKERSSKAVNEGGRVWKDTRTYLRNNIAFKVESRTAPSSAEIRKLPYALVVPADGKYPDENYAEELKTMNEAIAGTDNFEMVFQQMTTYPDAHYIVLKSKNKSAYTASILVTAKDALIDSLLTVPSQFKDEKLHLKWRIADKEAVYVPVADTVTSASGLNK